MGKTFVHHVLSGELGTPKKVIIFSRDEASALTKEFSFADSVLDLRGTVELLKKHKLMFKDRDLTAGEEFLR